MPAIVPVTTPLREPIDAPVLLHTPPAGPLSAIPPPGHILPAPLMVAGNGFMVTIVLLLQPVPIE